MQHCFMAFSDKLPLQFIQHCNVPIIIDPPFHITYSEIPVLALYLGVSTKFTGTNFQSSLSISLYWISTFIPVATLVAVVPVSMQAEMHTLKYKN